jgi:hypothetical protein
VTGRNPDPEPGRPTPEPAAGAPSGPTATPRIRRRSPVRRPSGEPLLPDVTADERDLGWGERPDPDDDDRLLREVPPHHGQ